MRMILLAAGAVLMSAVAFGQTTTQATDPTARTTSKPATAPGAEKEAASKDDRLSVTHHSITVAGRTLRYTATAGTLAQKDEAGKPKADMFFVAYTLDRDRDAEGRDDRHERSAAAATTPRPVTFVFNGGPGAASVWLHLGTAGPKRIDIRDDGVPAAPPFRLVDNEATWLDATDLVFIDPVGTGYSRPAQGEKGEQFYGVREDVQSVGAFIRLYTTRYRRWTDPKFLAGESYGTTRAAGLSEYLLEKQGISLNGIVLISAVLNFQTLATGGGNDLPYALYLPSYAATAWHHKKLPAELQADLAKTLGEVEAFALNEYTVALMKGDTLSPAERDALAQRLARYTGLDAGWIRKANLRVDPTRFRKQLLGKQGKLVGRFDSRITGEVSDAADVNAEYDPSLSQFLPLYSGTFNDFVRTTLRFESDLPYEVLTERVHPWNFGQGGSGFLYVADTLRDTLLKNPQLKVLIASGQMDLATPYLASDYTVSHLGLSPELRKNVVQTYYPAGHMLYHDPASRRQLHEDVAGFIHAAVGTK
jgi:carboxypeptidase C (cathepsin A)